MKILVISDTHKSTSNLIDLMEATKGGFETIIHLGDFFEDIIPFEKLYPGITFHYVRGNCDFDDPNAPLQKTISVMGKKIWLTHGHRYSVKSSFDRISYAAQEKEADVCLFGHSHHPASFYFENTLFMNPGSLSFPRGFPVASYGVLDISQYGVITPQIVGIYDRKLYRSIDI